MQRKVLINNETANHSTKGSPDVAGKAGCTSKSRKHGVSYSGNKKGRKTERAHLLMMGNQKTMKYSSGWTKIPMKAGSVAYIRKQYVRQGTKISF